MYKIGVILLFLPAYIAIFKIIEMARSLGL